jgi:hypothetical protein
MALLTGTPALEAVFARGIPRLSEPGDPIQRQRLEGNSRAFFSDHPPCDLATPGHAQFLIATHSPILLSYPGAVLFSLDGDTIQEIGYRDTTHFLITRDFLSSPERFFKHLFGAVDDDGTDTRPGTAPTPPR